MVNLFKAVAAVAASKVVGGLVALGVSIGVVIPLDESSTITATLTLAIAAVLQLLWQVLVAWAEKKWPEIARIRPLVIREMLRGAATPARPAPPATR